MSSPSASASSFLANTRIRLISWHLSLMFCYKSYIVIYFILDFQHRQSGHLRIKHSYCVCLRVCGHTWVSNVGVILQEPPSSGFLLFCCFLLAFETQGSLPWAWSSLSRQGWLTTTPRNPPVSVFPVFGIISVGHDAWLCHGGPCA